MSFTLDIPEGNIQLSGNPIYIVGSTSTINVVNHRLLCKITCNDFSIPGGPWTDEIQPLNGQSIFDISGIVDTTFENEFDIDSQSPIIEHDFLAANITIEIGEKYIDANGELVVTWSGLTEEMVILKGKLSSNEYTTLAMSGSSFFKHYIEGKRFLTQTGNNILQQYYVSKASEWVKLWFCFPDNVFSPFSIVIYYIDGTYTAPIPIDITFESNKLYELNAHKILCMYANPRKTVKKYQIRNSFGRKVNVNISNAETDNHEELLIVNRFGVVEVLHCYGETSETISTSGETYTKAFKTTPSVFEPTVISEGGRTKVQYKLNTGYRTVDERRWIKDLLEYNKLKCWFKSKRLKLISGKDFGLSPAIINTGSTEIDTSNIDLMNIEINIELAYID